MGEYINSTSTRAWSERTCGYTFPGRALNMGTFQRDMEYAMSSSKEGANLAIIIESAILYETSDKPIGRRSGITFDVLKIDKETEFEYNSPPHFDAYTIKWYWCAKTFHNLSASQGEVDIGTTSSEPLQVNADYKVDDPFGLYYDPYLIVGNTSSSSALYQTPPPPILGLS
ncbi:hypothetical protein CH63R_10555 [Colletotrichum higginsianum IMI 349063]|uniref:Uncharacterized protein n=1 Tax=Colletotrichum higginsianum (strain IMI 349063) TaxID=759273 RepID=A0A1B7Y393_COLHI|nr:uncharacterized protein CH63R_10555 [Colletotrichum higginsianum IMI 349063]OBR06435.1 hypothetical protein CH63R_10555 [Colletotrichum higginsianum IMI 349063]